MNGGILSNLPDYAASSTVVPASPPSGSRRPSGLAIAVIAGLVLSVAVGIWALVVRYDRASYVSGLLDHSAAFDDAAAAHQDDRVQSAATAVLVTYLATAAVFVTWFAIVVRRLHAARPLEFRHKAGWAIGAWFVPILNLVRPKQIADDAWHAAAGRGTRVPAVFHFWWALYLIGNATTYIGARLTNSDDPNTLMNGDRVGAVGDGIWAVAAILAIVVVTRLDVAARHVQPELIQPAPPAGPAAVPPPGMVFNAPPGWPTPPSGWVPPPGWHPDPAWPPAPDDWQFWVSQS